MASQPLRFSDWYYYILAASPLRYAYHYRRSYNISYLRRALRARLTIIALAGINYSVNYCLTQLSSIIFKMPPHIPCFSLSLCKRYKSCSVSLFGRNNVWNKHLSGVLLKEKYGECFPRPLPQQKPHLVTIYLPPTSDRCRFVLGRGDGWPQ